MAQTFSEDSWETSPFNVQSSDGFGLNFLFHLIVMLFCLSSLLSPVEYS